uniref:Uncharacterized protein n=2 Tax=Zea mays TaxID=4577 RepID=A0A804PSX2_MAIZE
MAPSLEDLTRVLAELAARLSQPATGGVSSSSGDSLSATIFSSPPPSTPVPTAAALHLEPGFWTPHGRHSYDMLYAVAKTIVLSPNYQCLFLLPYYKEEGEIVSRMGTIAAELINHPSYHVLPSDDSNPPRLLLWHLDPSIIRLDLSVMLKEITITLLVSRNGFELCARTSQCIGIIGTRHSSQAYAMRNIHRFGAEISLFTCLLPKPSKKLACNTNWTLILDWYMIISFPVWFSFATALLFYREGSHDSLSETLSKEPTAESISDVSLVQRAAFYLSWVLCPSNDDQCEMLSNNILEISHSWARNNKKCLSYQITMNHRRKLQIPTAAKSEKFHVPINTVSSLVKEFDDSCVPVRQNSELLSWTRSIADNDHFPPEQVLGLHGWLLIQTPKTTRIVYSERCTFPLLVLVETPEHKWTAVCSPFLYEPVVKHTKLKMLVELC